ncbi:MAG: TonB family protein [Pyrinomonadaceae bacterium]
MKIASFPRIKFSRLFIVPLFLFASLALSMSAFAQTPQQLSLADILIGLRSKKATLPERNRILADAVKVRGITFALTPEIEKELAGTGADSELIEAVRVKSPVIKAAATPLAKPVATPAATPVPTPTPVVQDFAFYQKRANISVGSGDFDSAITDYTKAIELKSEASAFLSRGFAFHNKKKYDLAVADYDKGIELNPKDASAYLNRGNSYEQMGNLEKAAADFKKALELDASIEAAKTSLQRIEAEQAKSALQKKETVPVNEPSNPIQSVEQGLLNNLALNLIKPAYPEIARKSNIQGSVTVKVTLDEEGKVVSAKATDGPSMLRPTAEDAARKSKFRPAMVGTQAVKSTGFITYSFRAN